ncbi:hypothetical protein [Clostridium oryzae]|uniref:Uncharacterized protein n=1 Tax=Clostridium oryzae TaxID=1450648 RepID=A0A1V4I7B6_9CLOT|nr:hypothetical protein [Clostridium oryzae]OPJ55505.1 hypothetical protein CLORY_44070 [Clostridium oryzae]
MIYVIVIVIILIVFTKALCSLSKEDDDINDNNIANNEVGDDIESKE